MPRSWRWPGRRRRAPVIPCVEMVELVTDYLEGTLPGHQARLFEEHLALCEACTAYVEQMRAMLATLGEIRLQALPPQAEDELRAAFRDWRRAGDG